MFNSEKLCKVPIVSKLWV